MKTSTHFGFVLLLTFWINTNAKAGDPFKIYQVTADGSFHFTYPDAEIANKEGTKPVTVRTFFLETMRHNLLPADLTYEAFLEMSPDEIQAMIEQNQWHHLAALEADKGEAMRIMMNIPSVIDCQPTILNAQTERVLLPQEEVIEMPVAADSLIIPWIVKVIVDPDDGYELPDFDNLPALQVNPGKQEFKKPVVLAVLEQ